MIKVTMVYYIGLLFIFGCGDLSEQQANHQRIKDGIIDRKIKRVTEDQIISAAYDQGNILVKQLDQLSTDVTYWLTPDGQSVLDSMNLAMGHEGFRLVLIKKPPYELLTQEAALLEAYQYSIDNGHPVNQNVQDIEGQYLLFTFPISNNGEFLGMWSIRLSRKTLIRNL
jgi:hypothetical protein